jgi:hypothetical protein
MTPSRTARVSSDRASAVARSARRARANASGSAPMQSSLTQSTAAGPGTIHPPRLSTSVDTIRIVAPASS